jgi:hypothetical protein
MNRFGDHRKASHPARGRGTAVYYAFVAAFMLVLPALSLGIESATRHVPLDAALAERWFVFWAVGARLIVAGLKQVTNPAWTARTILGIRSEDAFIVVRELGFANLSIGAIGLLTIAFPTWLDAAATAGAIFYGLAGINHVMQPRRNRLENVAMATDLFAAVVLVVLVVL